MRVTVMEFMTVINFAVCLIGVGIGIGRVISKIIDKEKK